MAGLGIAVVAGVEVAVGGTEEVVGGMEVAVIITEEDTTKKLNRFFSACGGPHPQPTSHNPQAQTQDA